MCYTGTGVPVQESRIYSMISDGLQMSHSSAADKIVATGVDTLSSGKLFRFVFLLGKYCLSRSHFLK